MSVHCQHCGMEHDAAKAGVWCLGCGLRAMEESPPPMPTGASEAVTAGFPNLRLPFRERSSGGDDVPNIALQYPLVEGIQGAGHLRWDELHAELARGGRLVMYRMAISVLILTFMQPSRMFYVPPGHWGLLRGLPYTLGSLMFGWWGFPWGLIYTPWAVLSNTFGGVDVTDELEWGALGMAPPRAYRDDD